LDEEKVILHKLLHIHINSVLHVAGKKKKHSTSVVFGVPLSEVSRSASVVADMLSRLETEEGLSTVGIYREDSAMVYAIQAMYDAGRDVDVAEFDFVACAGVMKRYLELLPEPLMTYGAFGQFMATLAIPDENTRAVMVRACYQQIPETNRALLERLIRHWRFVSLHSFVVLLM